MDNRKRPKSVTLIACILIAASLYYFANATANLLKSDSMSSAAVSKVSALLWLIISGVAGVVSGIAILKGLNWGRLLCLCYMPISIISYNILLIAGFRFLEAGFLKAVYLILVNIVAIGFYAIVIAFLKRPASLAFLTHGSSEE
jgi:hypothetical protein